MTTMGKRIHDKRVEYGLTMEELGQKLGVQRQTVFKWENGTVQNIKRGYIEQMARLFECDPVWLMGFEDASKVLLTYSAPGRETVTTRVDQKSKPIIGETALRMKLYQAALNVPAPCLEVAIQLLNSLSAQVHETFSCSEKCCHLKKQSDVTIDGFDYSNKDAEPQIDAYIEKRPRE